MKSCVLRFICLGFLLPLSGCGSGSVAPVAAPLNTRTLKGNWLLTESMPTNTFEPRVPLPFRMAITLDVTGDTITAAGFANDVCADGEGTISYGLDFPTGTIASDGSFTIQTPGYSPTESVTIQGTVPKIARGTWPGSYSAAITTTRGSGCKASSSGSFTAKFCPLVKEPMSGQ
jgi:hypothetical protein